MPGSSFAQRLAMLRKENNLTQAGLAEKTQVSRSAISLYELGVREPELATVKRLADFFRVSVDYLLGRTPLRWGLGDIPAEHLAKFPQLKAALESLEAPRVDPADLPRLMREAGLSDREVELLMGLVKEFLARRAPESDDGPAQGQPGPRGGS